MISFTSEEAAFRSLSVRIRLRVFVVSRLSKWCDCTRRIERGQLHINCATGGIPGRNRRGGIGMKGELRADANPARAAEFGWHGKVSTRKKSGRGPQFAQWAHRKVRMQKSECSSKKARTHEGTPFGSAQWKAPVDEENPTHRHCAMSGICSILFACVYAAPLTLGHLQPEPSVMLVRILLAAVMMRL